MNIFKFKEWGEYKKIGKNNVLFGTSELTLGHPNIVNSQKNA